MLRNYVNECMPAHTDTETRQKEKKKPHKALSALMSVLTKTVPIKKKKERDLKSIARRKINCMAEHKRRNKVSSLLSSAVNETLVSALNKIEIKHVNERLTEVLTGFVFSVIKDQASVLYKSPLTPVVINMIFFSMIQGAVKYTLIRLPSQIIK